MENRYKKTIMNKFWIIEDVTDQRWPGSDQWKLDLLPWIKFLSWWFSKNFFRNWRAQLTWRNELTLQAFGWNFCSEGTDQRHLQLLEHIWISIKWFWFTSSSLLLFWILSDWAMDRPIASIFISTSKYIYSEFIYSTESYISRGCILLSPAS